MREWLVADCHLLGLTAQNWMWLLAAGFALYAGTLVFLRGRRRRAG